MMRIFIVILFIVAFAACKKDITSTIPVQDHVDTTIADVKYDGLFMDGPYGSVTGNVKIYQDSGSFKLALIDIMISNGPDLHVYLSKEIQPINFIDLGKLKSIAGTQVYSIAVAPDFSQYKYVLIHCQKYNHLFGSAAL